MQGNCDTSFPTTLSLTLFGFMTIPSGDRLSWLCLHSFGRCLVLGL